MKNHAVSPVRAAAALVLASLLLGGCASRSKPPAPNAPTRAADERITDERITLDHKAYADQQAAIQALNAGGGQPLRTYSIAKAQCWLDVSFHEYTRNDRSAFPDRALEQSRLITQHLTRPGRAADANPALVTPLVNDAQRLRPDLWQAVATLKAHPGFSCAQAATACGEVELVHAGNEINQQGWRHAKPYVQIAEDRIAQAQQQAQAYLPPPASPPPPPVVVAPPPAPTDETITLGAGALFRFNKSGGDDLLPEGRRQLDELAERLSRAYARVDAITLTGHTDRLGSDAYNAALSLTRAQTVKAYLASRGVTAPMSTTGLGAAQPVVQCEGQQPTARLTACLQPNRRVTIEVRGIRR